MTDVRIVSHESESSRHGSRVQILNLSLNSMVIKLSELALISTQVIMCELSEVYTLHYLSLEAAKTICSYFPFYASRTGLNQIRLYTSHFMSINVFSDF